MLNALFQSPDSAVLNHSSEHGKTGLPLKLLFGSWWFLVVLVWFLFGFCLHPLILHLCRRLRPINEKKPGCPGSQIALSPSTLPIDTIDQLVGYAVELLY